ncbi:TolC family protein [Terriglobus tenax]|uniref:TolC family protein n=1 Tax=Terriglobus tenax TaxID=1111115 RepID=UPI0021E006B2|nr:TolC family protein [Terriglobus tenax]
MNLRHLQATASIALLLMGPAVQYAAAQQQQTVPGGGTPAQAQANNTLPAVPEPKLTEPLFLRDTAKDYAQPKSHIFKPWAPYTPINVGEPRLGNTPRLEQLLRDGKIYLSLSDAVMLALENNYDIAIFRLNLDIADTDLLRARAGATLRGVSSGLVSNTLGGTTTTISGGGGPGGTTTAAGAAGAGASGLVLSTNGAGPVPTSFDPVLTSTIQLERAKSPQTTNVITGTYSLNQATNTYNFGYTQGFITGTTATASFNNTRTSNNNTRSPYNPQLQSTMQFRLQQHLLQGFGPSINGRFIVQAKNNRRIVDSAFRQQVISTVTQVESIYWALVSAYEDVQAKTRALDQSTKLASDNRKQLEIGTLAPLDIVNSDSAVSTDKQALITSQSNLEYQQLLIKQAIARSTNDQQIALAPVVPTDRVSLDRIPEEDVQIEDLVKQAYVNNPQIEQAMLAMKNNEISIKALKNGLLPTVDVYGFYGASTLGGGQNPRCSSTNGCTQLGTRNYGDVFTGLFDSSNPDKGVGLAINIPIRNRVAQADQARSQMELRQSQMRLQQLYTQMRMLVTNAQFALTNDRAAVQSAQAARDYQAQSLDSEQKKYRLGASTTANVLQQERNLATAENSLISATAAYARDRASLYQLLANTMDRYGISLVDAANGTMSQAPVIPGLTAPKAPEPPKPLTPQP